MPTRKQGVNWEGASICSLHLGESDSGKGEQGLDLSQEPESSRPRALQLCDLGKSLYLF